MKQKLSNIKNKLVALWWFLTRKNYYLLSYNGRKSKFLESGNVVIPEFIEWVRKKHGVLTNQEIIKELQSIYEAAGSDTLVALMCKDLIDKLRD